ncbi:hypothetical protein [Mesotoga sp.]|uniref:hypothetical protein n=1 Tax=Mesotoga sp. TaxID=2053577 RepID=UPI00345E0B5C
MKKTLAFLIIAALCVTALANGLLVVTLKDGSVYEFYLDEIESLVYVAEDELPLEPKYMSLEKLVFVPGEINLYFLELGLGLTPGSESFLRYYHGSESETTCTTFSMLTSVAADGLIVSRSMDADLRLQVE